MIKGINDKLDELMDKIVDYIFTKSQENIIKNKSVDTGFMLRSGNINRQYLKKEIVYSAPYSAHIEYGVKPHMPPVEALYNWVRRKLGLSDKKARKVVWAIAMKIKKKGLPPKPFIRPAIEEARRKFKNLKVR